MSRLEVFTFMTLMFLVTGSLFQIVRATRPDASPNLGKTIYYVLAAVLILIAAATFPAWPRDLDGRHANSPLAPWFKSLKQPTTGASCCDVTDCSRTEQQFTKTGYRAMVNGVWMDIPPEKVISNRGNPVGQPIVCYPPQATKSADIFCFVPGAGF